MQLARALNEVATSKGMRQADICRKTGLSDARVSQIFSGKIKDPKASIVYKIAHALGVSVDEVLELADSYDDLEEE